MIGKGGPRTIQRGPIIVAVIRAEGFDPNDPCFCGEDRLGSNAIRSLSLIKTLAATP